MTPTAILRVIGAVAALVGGYAHLKIYNDEYKDIPVEFGGVVGLDLGQQFLLNVLGAIAIALGLVVPLFVRVPDLIWKLAAIGGSRSGRRSRCWRSTWPTRPTVVGSTT